MAEKEIGNQWRSVVTEEKKKQPEDSGENRDAGIPGGIPEMVKKAILSGLGAVFLTEEGIRSYLSDLKLPKEAVQFLISQVAKTKEEALRVITEEIRSFLDNTQLDDVLRRVLTNISLEISTKVRFVDESGGMVPKASAKLRVKKEGKARSKKE